MALTVSPDQFSGPGKDIGDLIHTVLGTIAMMHPTRQHTRPPRRGFLLMLDFEKAFDSVSQTFIRDTLVAFGLPPPFVEWCMLGFISTEKACIINGKRTAFSQLEGGGRQGESNWIVALAAVSGRGQLSSSSTTTSATRSPLLRLRSWCTCSQTFVFSAN